MKRRTLLKSILAVPFLPKLLCGQTKEKISNDLDFKQTLEKQIYPEKSNYVMQTVYYSGNVVLLEGQYVIRISRHTQVQETLYNLKEVREAESWEDVVKSCKDGTFAGIVRKQTQCPGLVEIYACKEIP